MRPPESAPGGKRLAFSASGSPGVQDGPRSGGNKTQTQSIVDSQENMGKYGQWGGRHKPRTYGQIWGIHSF
eukprot:2224691-Pyramimonas_sp.AAC.1